MKTRVTSISKQWRNGRLSRHEINGVSQPLTDEAQPTTGTSFTRKSKNTVGVGDKIADGQADKTSPLWAKGLKLLATPEDKGIGDVAARVIGGEKSAAFKAWYKKTFGKSCGCSGRQADWNRRYPL
jgi:hypothetical protein